MGLNLYVSFICDKEKTEQIINSFQFQVLDDLKFALSTSYDKYSFNKCQVEQDLNVLCESFEELEDAVENYLSENELDMSI